MRRRTFIFVVVINVLVTLAVAYGVISLNQQGSASQFNVTVVTVPLLVTATTDPDATIPVRVITATPLPGSIAVGALPTGILDTTSGAPLNTTLDAQAVGVNPEGDVVSAATTVLPPNCILHVIESGDTPFGIAQVYGVSGFAVMEINGLDDVAASNLQIGQTLIVPLEGCPLTAADVAGAGATNTPPPAQTDTDTEATLDPDASPEATASPTVRPTLTLPPTAANAQVEIVEVINAGDVTAEGVVIRNIGNSINVNGWTLSDADGNSYTFAERVLFSNASVTLFTRVGQDTPAALFWNRSTAVLGPGDVLTLRNASGAVQSTYRLPSPVDLR